MLQMKRTNPRNSQIMIQKQKRIPNQTIPNQNQQLLQPKILQNKTRRIVMFNTETIRNKPATVSTTTAIEAARQAGINHSSNSSGSSHSSNGTIHTSPIILYKINSRANANAKRTILLLVLLLSFYVLCWAPYNIYTWNHAYQLTKINQNESFINPTLFNDFNQTISWLTDNLHADLRRVIFINYSLYLLSMISMCFSFIFYFSLNKQARHEFLSIIGCICPRFKRRKNMSKQNDQKPRGLQYNTRYQHHYPKNDQRPKTMKFKTHSTFVSQAPLLLNRQNNNKHINYL
jgi:hypothetical protein